MNQTYFNVYFNDFYGLIQKDLFSNIFNLGIYITGMVFYVIVIWHFYRNLAKKDLFKLEIKRDVKGFSWFFEKIRELFDFIIHYIFIFPIISFIWFLILSAFLLFLSKSNDVAQILLMSITIIATSRILAYYNENLADEVAKLVPYGLLGVFIVDPTYFSIDATLSKFFSLPLHLHSILQYLIALVFLEFSLKIIHLIFNPELKN